jgi:hypothetical protein
MSIPKIEEFNLDPHDPILRNADEFIRNGYWYLGASGAGAKTACGVNPDQEVFFGEYSADGKNVLKCKLNSNGTVRGSVNWKEAPLASGVWRQPLAWSDESCERRAQPIWDLFKYINEKFFDNEMSLDGFPEEIGGTRPMWSPKFGEDSSIPGFGTVPDVGNPVPIWTAYCTGKSGGIMLENPIGNKPRRPSKKLRGSAGPHRDAPVIREADGEGYYSIVCCMNPVWKPSWEGAAHYHETVDPTEAAETHWKRGYGIGHPTSVHPQRPGAVYLVPSTAIHTGMDLPMPNRPVYQRRLLFRVKRKSTPVYVQPAVDCPSCDWNGIVSANGHCPECNTYLDLTYK